jgi:argininosuccinate lyase
MKLWGGRFETGPSEVFEQFSGSLHFDGKLILADVRGSQAFACALQRAGILAAVECDQIVAAFDAIAQEAQNPDYLRGATDEDVHTFVIRQLQAKVGALAGKIHTGRSRNEQVSLDVRLYLRASAETVLEQLTQLMAALLTLGEKYPQAVIPGYTHLRRAQAVLWPHYLLAYFEMLARDFERMEQTRVSV